MEFILEPTVEKSQSVWDDYVPVIQLGRSWDIYLTENIDFPSNYNKLYHLLRNAYPGDVTRLHINNGGGMVDSAFFILEGIKQSKATVVAHLSGTVASAATIIALSCHELVIADNLAFMIHNYSSGMAGKGHELKAYQTFTDRELNHSFRNIYRGFLTDTEMNEVIEGRDIWLNATEVAERWANKQLSC